MEIKAMEIEAMELQEAVNQVNNIELEEIVNQIENIIITINDIRDVIILIFGFYVGYIIIRDFIKNILKSV